MLIILYIPSAGFESDGNARSKKFKDRFSRFDTIPVVTDSQPANHPGSFAVTKMRYAIASRLKRTGTAFPLYKRTGTAFQSGRYQIPTGTPSSGAIYTRGKKNWRFSMEMADISETVRDRTIW